MKGKGGAIVCAPPQGFKRAPPPSGEAVQTLAKRPRGAGGEDVGEVRFDSLASTQRALHLDGASINGNIISVLADGASQDGTKILVTNLPSGLTWQELKTFFSTCGLVLFAHIGAPGSRPATARVPTTGEVRFESTEEAAHAQAMLDGSVVDGSTIQVRLDLASKDATKLYISGLPPGTEWQELKDFCGQFGRVAYSRVDATPSPNILQRVMPAMAADYGQARAVVQQPAVASQGEVRFETAQHALLAVQTLNGTFMRGSQIFLQVDPTVQDGSRLVVHNVAPGATWQELKEHFASVGSVTYAQVRASPSTLPGGAPAAYPPPVALPARPAADASVRCNTVAMAGGGGGGAMVGEVRYAAASSAQMAVVQLNGSIIRGTRVTVALDNTSTDGTKVLVMNLPPMPWQELKDQFQVVGQVMHARVKAPPVPPMAAAPMGYGGGVQYLVQQPLALQSGARRPTPAGGFGGLGEVRYENPQHALLAVQQLNNSIFLGSVLNLQLSTASQDGTKVSIRGIPPGAHWNDLKQHFGQVGPVAYAAVPQGDMGAAVSSTQGKKPQPKVISGMAGAGEVRYVNSTHAQAALQSLAGLTLRGQPITITVDPKSQDETKLMVSDLPEGVDWKELRDHFAQFGEVAYAGVLGPGEVRYEAPESAQLAVQQFDGHIIEGSVVPLSVRLDTASTDGTKIVIENLPAAVRWQEIKDIFGAAGKVAYAARAGSK